MKCLVTVPCSLQATDTVLQVASLAGFVSPPSYVELQNTMVFPYFHHFEFYRLNLVQLGSAQLVRMNGTVNKIMLDS